MSLLTHSVEAEALTKDYGPFRAVDNVSLRIPTGSIYGILGPNGAGKTTTLRMLMGIIDPDSGSRRVLGSDQPRTVRRRIGYLPEERGLYPGMAARDAIAFMGALRGLDWNAGRKRGAADMEALGLGDVVTTKIRKLSKGMAQMVQLVGALVHAPELIVLDEPFLGLDPANQERLEALIQRERTRGATVIFSTHVMAHAQRLCDRLAIIARSRRRFEGTVDDARALLPMQVHYSPRKDGDTAELAAALPADALCRDGVWHFPITPDAVEPLLRRLTPSDWGVRDLAIARPALHDAFVRIVQAADAESGAAPAANGPAVTGKVAS